MNDFFRNKAKIVLNILPVRFICKREFKKQTFVRFNERPVEFGFVFKNFQRLYPLRILDVGTGMTALPQLMRNCGCLVTAIDNIKEYWPAGMSNRHYHVINCDITKSTECIHEKYDLITCISVLEHIEKHDSTMKNMFSLLNPKGHLILTFPYSENHFVKNVYELPDSYAFQQDIPYICQSFSRNELTHWFDTNDGIIIEQEYWQFWDGDFWTTGKQIIPPIRVTSDGRHQLTCLLIQKT